VTNSAGRHSEFVGRILEALVTFGCLEDAKSIERRQSTHRSSPDHFSPERADRARGMHELNLIIE
jgi:hypothetical protein